MVQPGPAHKDRQDCPGQTTQWGLALLFCALAMCTVQAQQAHQASQIIFWSLLYSQTVKGLSCHLSPHGITTTGFLFTDAYRGHLFTK